MTSLALAVPVGTASLAYACTALATLTVTSGSVAAGQTVSGTGKGFNGGLHDTPVEKAVKTPVVMRLDTRSGPILGSFVPADSSGNVVWSFAVPSGVSAGQHVLIGVQNDPISGQPYYGTPARQTVTVGAAAGRSAAAKADGVPAPVVAAEPASAAPVAAVAAPAAAGAAAATGAVVANAATEPASTQVATAPAAPAGQVATGSAPAALTSDGAQPAAALAASAPTASAAAATTTVTPALVATSSPEGRSILPAMLLLVLGLGIGLTASARWAVARLPQLRKTAAA